MGSQGCERSNILSVSSYGEGTSKTKPSRPHPGPLDVTWFRESTTNTGPFISFKLGVNIGTTTGTSSKTTSDLPVGHGENLGVVGRGLVSPSVPGCSPPSFTGSVLTLFTGSKDKDRSRKPPRLDTGVTVSGERLPQSDRIHPGPRLSPPPLSVLCRTMCNVDGRCRP